MVRNFSAIAVGLIAGMLVTVIGLLIFTSLYPQPNELDMSNRAAINIWEDNLPKSAFTTKFIINMVATIFASILFTVISKDKKIFSLLGLILFISIILWRDLHHSYEQRFIIFNIILMLFTGLLGIYIGSRRAKDLINEGSAK
jgi:hypothetical protein